MKTSKKVLMLLLLSSTVCYTQSNESVKTEKLSLELISSYGGEGREKGYAVTADMNGDVYVTSTFSNSIDLTIMELNEVDEYIESPQTFTAKGEKDALITKYERSGELLWAKQLSATSYLHANVIDARMTSIVVAGTFKGDFTYLIDGEERKITSKDQTADAFVLMMNQEGEIERVVQFGGNAEINMVDLQVGESNTVYLSGNFKGKCNFNTSKTWAEKRPDFLTSGDMDGVHAYNSFILKLSYYGGFQWVKQISNSFGTHATSLALDKDQNIYLAGNFEGEASFSENEEISVVSDIDAFVAKYNETGELVWVKSYGGIGEESITSIALKNENQLIIAGYFSGPTSVSAEDESPLFMNLKGNGTNDGFITSLNLDGEISWTAHIQKPEDIFLRAVEVYSNGDILAAGYSKAEGSFLRNLILVKLDKAGSTISETIIKEDYILPNDIVITERNNAFICGHFKEQLEIGTNKVSSNGSSDVFLIKIK